MNAVEEVKQRTDIVEVIGSYVPLLKAGRNFKAACPFHSERTPSFFVSPERQSWHCFGACGEGGDVFSFVMKREGLEFAQALRMLAERVGVNLPERRERDEDPRTERAYQANEAAAKYYGRLLLSRQAGKVAMDYLTKRGVDLKAIQQFSLGYSPEGWDNIRPHLLQLGFTAEDLLRAGLLVEGESGSHDRFRGRIMFPIWDVRGRVAGFGARALDHSVPKYINTPQTDVFDKGGNLYYLSNSRDDIRRVGYAVIVEGYMDVIAAHQHGFTNVLASMGTALTERQMRLVRRYTRKVVLALDADAAGSEAVLKGREAFEEAVGSETGQDAMPTVSWDGLVRYQDLTSLDLCVAQLPAGQDPDDVIRESHDVWSQLVEQAKPILDHFLGSWSEKVSQGGTNDPQLRARAVQDLLPMIGAVADPVIRAHYLQRLARLSLVKEEQLAAALAPTPTRRSIPGPPARPDISVGRRSAREEFLLALLLRHPVLRGKGLGMPVELLWQAENRAVMDAWRRAGNVSSLLGELPDELHDHVDHLLQRQLPNLDEGAVIEVFDDCLSRLVKRGEILQKQASVAALAEEEASLGPSVLAAAASARWRGEQVLPDRQLAHAADLEMQDLEAGLRLHKGSSSHDVEAEVIVDE